MSDDESENVSVEAEVADQELQEPSGTRIVTTMGVTYTLQIQPVTTGEENERTLFAAKVELTEQVVKNEWEERADGVLKLLEDNTTGRRRLLVRQDKTNVVRANHRLVAGMRLVATVGSDKAWIWCAPADVANGEAKRRILGATFDTPALPRQFKAAFDEAVPH